ncbi:VWA domain-containing protein [Streptomyces sp. LP05-1]|uniref:VWA domain-containing protein n=1 Tax=Streptomyces pyxinae TaxID=2970734 RepID=A0ABT2CD66_9ACTN|nr:VWA domain-containing protein [Streptomyces sp. LP05-1]MCS0635316.1 VWA domain-containing protein [Streptomyces sp. LP05-1]
MGTLWQQRRTRRGRAYRGTLAALGCAALLGSAAAPAASARVPGRAAAEPAFPAVNYAVAVDESESLAPEDMKAEKAAAARIALGDVSASSTVSVFGFAAAERAGQRAVDPVCPRTTLDAAGREAVGGCVEKLRSRKKDEGTGTDFPTAIRQGVHDLTAGTDATAPRVLFLLTDGKMDVSGSDKYGDPAHRAAEGERQLTLALREAAAARVQIWPLGFGDAPDKKQLDRMAAGGYQRGCVALPSARPRAEKVSGAGDVGPTLERVFAAAHCLRYQSGPTAQRPPATLEVEISPLATVGSIVVDKGDPAVRISYLDPSGHQVPTSGAYQKSTFELAGAGGVVEALKIVDPVPGRWKIRAEADEDHRALPVGVSVLWQGELRGAITMNPPSPRPGEKTTVTMRLQTREGYEIRDPADYAGLAVAGRLSGAGFAPLAVGLSDSGTGADAAEGDGSFTGTVRIPSSATGALTASATLTAAGLRADTRSETGTVATAAADVVAGLTLRDAEAHPGAGITGTLALHNTDDAPHTLRLSADDVQAGLLTVSPGEVKLKPGESVSVGVTVRVAEKALFGDRLTDEGLRLGSTVTVTDTTDGNRALVRSPLSVRVTPEPTFLERNWWALAGGALLLVALAVTVVLVIRQRRVRVRPSGLVLRLVSGDGEQLAEHRVGLVRTPWYGFGLTETHRSPRIEKRANGPYAVQRSPEGGAVLRTRGGGRTKVPAQGRAVLTDELYLALGDEPRRPGRRSAGWWPWSRPAPNRRPAPAPADAAPRKEYEVWE